MSQHVIVQDEKRFTFGWDQPLQSFYLQIHDLPIVDEDAPPRIWLGADSTSRMPGIGVLVREAKAEGLIIPRSTQNSLYLEKSTGV